MLVYVTRDKDMIDHICFKHYGRHDGGLLDAVFAANPHLSAEPAILSAGLTIALPDEVSPSATLITRLWD